MIRNCSNCGGRLTFDIRSQKLVCDNCNSSFKVSNFISSNEEASNEAKKLNMNVCIYSCSACGAEIAVTDTEASTFCVFCGNANVLFNRNSDITRPSRIIPFTVTKEEAVANIQRRFKNGFYIASEIKNFSIESVQSVYIPYFATKVEYDGAALINSEIKGNATGTSLIAYGQMPYVLTGASSKLNSDIYKALEPYDMIKSKFFDEDYLLGFYSEIPNSDIKSAIPEAKKKAVTAVDSIYLNSRLLEGDKRKIIFRRDLVEVYDDPYVVLCPTWFLTLKHNDKPFTILVNGQTGKVVGGVPSSTPKVALTWIAYSVLYTAIVAALAFLIFILAEKSYIGVIYGAVPAVIVGIVYLIKSALLKGKINSSVERTYSDKLIRFSNDRRKDV